MLPSVEPRTARITDVLPSCYAALGVEQISNPLALSPADCIVLVLVDGLGLRNLMDSLGHAPFLRRHSDGVVPMRSVFPTTTATALASWATGADPGAHGIMGYEVRDPESGQLINQLKNLDRVSHLDTWLGTPTLARTAHETGIDSVVVGLRRFTETPLTRVVHDGMRYVDGGGIVERVDRAFTEVASGANLVVVYFPELDQVGHTHGWRSDAWCARLETLDAELSRLRAGLRPNIPIFVTSDHGMVDVPTSGHIDVGLSDLPLDHVVTVGGEPRGLQLYLDPDADVSDVARHWRQALGDAAWVATRADVVENGWWVDSASTESRAGDIVVLARDDIAFYPASDPGAPARGMRGQHGSLTERELAIPWLRL